MDEKISDLTEQDIIFLNGRKSSFFVNAILLSLGSAFTVTLFAVGYQKMPDAGGWFIGIPLAAVLIFYLYLMSKSVSKISQINKAIKHGKKKTITIKLEDYEETGTTSESGHYTPTNFYFKADNQKYEVTKEQYYKFLNGDLVNISFTPNLDYVLQIEKNTDQKSIEQ